MMLQRGLRIKQMTNVFNPDLSNNDIMNTTINVLPRICFIMPTNINTICLQLNDQHQQNRSSQCINSLWAATQTTIPVGNLIKPHTSAFQLIDAFAVTVADIEDYHHHSAT